MKTSTRTTLSRHSRDAHEHVPTYGGLFFLGSDTFETEEKDIEGAVPRFGSCLSTQSAAVLAFYCAEVYAYIVETTAPLRTGLRNRKLFVLGGKAFELVCVGV